MNSTLQRWWRVTLVGVIGLFLAASQGNAQNAALFSADSPTNLLSNGGFEVMKPAYWEPSGDGAVWTRDMSRTPDWSLELTGSGEASWMQPEAVRNWVPGIPGGENPELVGGAWVYTEGVNTNPANDDEKFQLILNFYTDATQSENVLGEPVVIDLPQDAASTGDWVRISTESLGALIFPGEQAAKSATIEFRKGANATGTAYLDDVFLTTVPGTESGWAGGYFNTNVDAGDTWYYWWDGFDAGLEGWPENQAHYLTVSDDDAYQGDYSLRIESGPFDPSKETVGISQRVPVDGPMLVSFRVKHEGNAKADSIGIGNNNLGLTVLWYENMEAGAAGYGELGGLDIILNGDLNTQLIPLITEDDGSDWKQYAFVVYPLDGAVGMEIRPRYWHGFSGVSYWDDFYITPLSTAIEAMDDLNELTNGDFEVMKPAYWEASGDGAVWSHDMSRTPEWSLELTGSGEASWMQPEAVRDWVPGIPGGENPELVAGAWVYTEGVNTSPANDDEKFQLIMNFYTDATQSENVLGEPIVIDLPQDAASTGGWVRISSESLGALIFPGEQAAKSATIEFRKGANATGTAYMDDVFLTTVPGTESGWAGGYFNTNADAGDTWYYWWDGFDAGLDGWPESQAHINTVTNADASDGEYSLRLETGPTFDPSKETVGISERVAAMPGEPLLMTFKVKHEGNVKEDSIGIGNNNLGLTVLWYENMEAGAAGYGELGGADIILDGTYNPQFIPLLHIDAAGKVNDGDWTQYGFVTYPLEGAIGTEIRPRYWHGFSGVSYWDEFKVIPLGGLSIGTAIEEDVADGTLPRSISLHQNYPNPFNPATTIAFDLKEQSLVSLSVYNVMGQEVASLLSNQILGAGTQRVQFQADDLPSGTYLYVLKVGNATVAQKMVLLK